MPRRECRGIGGVCQQPSSLIERTDFAYADLFPVSGEGSPASGWIPQESRP
jgi:hypothetical protein